MNHPPPPSPLRAVVKGRGMPPASFLNELVTWGRSAPDEIFDVNTAPGDVMARVREVLGPWEGLPGTPERLLHRKCCFLELLRCLAGFESSWDWNEGVDTTNKRSQSKIECQETGIFQVSHDSLALDKSGALRALCEQHGIHDATQFIHAMKGNHSLALTYCAKLLRLNYQWDGPIKRKEIDSSLSKEAVQEFKRLMAA